MISEEYYILASEYVAREIPKNNNFKEIIAFLKMNKSLLMQHEDFMYYFVEALVARTLCYG